MEADDVVSSNSNRRTYYGGETGQRPGEIPAAPPIGPGAPAPGQEVPDPGGTHRDGVVLVANAGGRGGEAIVAVCGARRQEGAARRLGSGGGGCAGTGGRREKEGGGGSGRGGGKVVGEAAGELMVLLLLPPPPPPATTFVTQVNCRPARRARLGVHPSPSGAVGPAAPRVKGTRARPGARCNAAAGSTHVHGFFFASNTGKWHIWYLGLL